MNSEPWRACPPAVADLIEPELAAVTEEILDDDRPRGAGVRAAAGGALRARHPHRRREALRQFVALIRDPEAGRESSREVYVALGRGELRQGRTLDSLQAAYRVGARVAWRRLAEAGARGRARLRRPSACSPRRSLPTSTSSPPTRSRATPRPSPRCEDQRRRRRARPGLAADARAGRGGRRPACRRAGIRLEDPAQSRRTRLSRGSSWRQLARRLPADALATPLDEVGCVLVPDPGGPGRMAAIERAVAGTQAGARIGTRIGSSA